MNGVPWDIALEMDEAERTGAMIAIGEMKTDKKFDFTRMKFPD